MRVLDSGKATLRDIQRLLGHERPTTTDTYLKRLSPDLRHLADVLDQKVGNAGASSESGKTIP